MHYTITSNGALIATVSPADLASAIADAAETCRRFVVASSDGTEVPARILAQFVAEDYKVASFASYARVTAPAWMYA